jgi:hypothetical protein
LEEGICWSKLSEQLRNLSRGREMLDDAKI